MYQTTLPVVGSEFRDRRRALAQVIAAITRLKAGSPKWLALLGQRKVGKTSLLLEAARRSDDAIAFAIIDVFNHLPINGEFFRLLALRVVEAIFSPECGQSLEMIWDPNTYRAVLSQSQKFGRLSTDLKRLLLALRDLPAGSLEVPSLLQIPEQLATALKIHIVVAIDEFQELAELKVGRPAKSVLPMLRAVWQRHQRVAYMVSGSARSMMTNLATSQRSPFFGHFDLLEIEGFSTSDAQALLIDGAVPGRPISKTLAARAVDAIGGNPFYLQLLGEQLAALEAPLDEAALKEALSRLVFHRTGRLAMFFEAELQRVVGRSGAALALLEHVARAPSRPADLQRTVGLSSSSTVNYLARLGDIIRIRDDGHYDLTDPLMAQWLRWRTPGGAAVPMTLIGDEAERAVAQHLSKLGFELVYQSKASRGAFDLLALRAGVMVGIQVKRMSLPVHFSKTAWNRMEAEAKRLGWLWLVAAVNPESDVSFLDPANAKRSKGVALNCSAAIENLLVWVDNASAPKGRRAPR